MAILRPAMEKQFEVSLESEDGELSFPDSFLTSNGFQLYDDIFGYTLGQAVPIELTSCFDPEYFRPLIDYILDLRNGKVKEKLFILTVELKTVGGLRETWQTYKVTGCKLKSFKFLKVDRESVKVADLSLTLEPGTIFRVKED